MSGHEDLNTVKRDETKYGDRIGGREWEPEDNEEGNVKPHRTDVVHHEIAVIYHTDPDKTDGYGREKYEAVIRDSDPDGDRYILHVVEYRWKGNYWRDVRDWDWRDVPEPVRQQIADAAGARPADLDSGTRLIEEGGESRWQKYHKHRVRSMSGDEMWGLSFLKDALDPLDSAAEAFDDGTRGKRIAEKVAAALRKGIRGLEKRHDGEETTEQTP